MNLSMICLLLQVCRAVLLEYGYYDEAYVFSAIVDQILTEHIRIGKPLDNWFIIENDAISRVCSSNYYFSESRYYLIHHFEFIQYCTPHSKENPFSTLYPCYKIYFDGILRNKLVVKKLIKLGISTFPAD